MSRPSRVVSLEEHFLTTDFEPDVPTPPAMLYELGDKRIEDMDRLGIDVQVLSLMSPGIQGIADTSEAISKARMINDKLAAACAKYPKRLAGFAALPTQDPKAAADELERCVKQLGFKGALINGHTHGHYLDEDQYLVLWERAAVLDVPLYLHPGFRHKAWDILDGYPELSRAAWGWSAETGAHALRIVCSGLFERVPNARLIIGHMGETIPFYLSRIDSRLHNNRAGNPSQLEKRLKMKVSDYIKRNIAITTSGVFQDEPLICSLGTLGQDSVMFSIDYPLEDNARAVTWLSNLKIPDAQREAVAHGNADRILKL